MTTRSILDRTDFAILRLLVNDARLSNKQIASTVGLAPSSCHERIKALRRRGVLLGAHAEVDLRLLGLALQSVLLVQLAKLKREAVDRFVRNTAKIPEVRGVFLISGRFDLIVHVVVRDMEHLKNLISEHFNRYSVVERVETSVVFDHKARHEMPILDTEGPVPDLLER
jgi:DNA-binding Lrp family transcriptional regulator